MEDELIMVTLTPVGRLTIWSIVGVFVLMAATVILERL
jgi:hypothetical protein